MKKKRWERQKEQALNSVLIEHWLHRKNRQPLTQLLPDQRLIVH
ncbi:hypothetical protein M23134_05362 [Microscilla marina ATCC 23134]|uniref:Uncharacterized protein n=1 Tax=Microscilla marina ATCC 23134 TaxID=313606 RepID=A1ZHM2_MICM2|nr:hypothetical protein M23134_05362 [Microscilla marina ATCC 23134]